MKKCPYCAEEIQDEAIVCRYCGSDLSKVENATSPQISINTKQKEKPANKKSILFIIVVLLCLILSVIVFVFSKTSQHKTASMEGTVTQSSTSTPQPTRTPRPMLGMTLAQFQSKWESMTNIQRNALIKQSVGKWVDWSSTIINVESDGIIFVNIPEEILGTVELKGIPQSVLTGLSKDQTIHFIGQITDIETIIQPYIVIDNAQLAP